MPAELPRNGNGAFAFQEPNDRGRGVLRVEGQHVMCMAVLGADGRVMLLIDDGYVLPRLDEEKAHGRQEMDPPLYGSAVVLYT
jgi:hypothetical protein